MASTAIAAAQWSSTQVGPQCSQNTPDVLRVDIKRENQSKRPLVLSLGTAGPGRHVGVQLSAGGLRPIVSGQSRHCVCTSPPAPGGFVSRVNGHPL